MAKSLVFTIVGFFIGAVLIGLLLGNGAVVLFNRVPGKWFSDGDLDPESELAKPTMQRIKSTPWKFVFTGFFLILSFYLLTDNYLYAIPTILAIWVLLLMSIADIKYMIVPDQFVFLLIICAIGYLPYLKIKEMIFGLILGFGVLALMALLSKLIYKKPGIGGADIKIFSALGLMTGPYGVAIIFILTTFISAIYFGILLLLKKVKAKDKKPMVPFIALSAATYLVVLHKIDFTL